MTPFKIWLEFLILTRFLTWFSPSIWGDADGYAWIRRGLSINNYDTEFFVLVRDGKIKIYVGDITHLSRRMVHLSDGIFLPADCLTYSTGWIQQSSIKFLPEGIEAELGLPHYSAKEPELTKKADTVILSKFPRLTDQPPRNVKYKPLPSVTDLKSKQLSNLTASTDSLCRRPSRCWTPAVSPLPAPICLSPQ